MGMFGGNKKAPQENKASALLETVNIDGSAYRVRRDKAGEIYSATNPLGVTYTGITLNKMLGKGDLVDPSQALERGTFDTDLNLQLGKTISYNSAGEAIGTGTNVYVGAGVQTPEQRRDARIAARTDKHDATVKLRKDYGDYGLS